MGNLDMCILIVYGLVYFERIDVGVIFLDFVEMVNFIF